MWILTWLWTWYSVQRSQISLEFGPVTVKHVADCMEQNPPRQANSPLGRLEFPLISWNSKVHHCIHTSWPPCSTQSLINPVQILHPFTWTSSLILSSYQWLDRPSGILSSCFNTNFLHHLSFPPNLLHAMPHHTPVDLIALTTLDSCCTLYSSSLCCPPFDCQLFLFSPEYFPHTLLSNTLSLANLCLQFIYSQHPLLRCLQTMGFPYKFRLKLTRILLINTDLFEPKWLTE